MTDIKKEKTEKKSSNSQKRKIQKDKKKTSFSGEYIGAVGRRKTSVAQVRMYKKGSGDILVNNVEAENYFKRDGDLDIALQPLRTVSKLSDFDISILVKGGGSSSQIGAVKHGIARGLIKFDPELKNILKTSGFITRDPRKKERKKPGLKKARKSPQWSKR